MANQLQFEVARKSLWKGLRGGHAVEIQGNVVGRSRRQRTGMLKSLKKYMAKNTERLASKINMIP
jgi:hypothetical protein